MMIMRAIFWIALVAVFMPHEPDLGLGRPDAVSLPGPIASLLGASHGGFADASGACAGHEAACRAGVTAAENFQSMMVKRLDEVREEIEQSRRAREANAG